jgi:hypothetical protein
MYMCHIPSGFGVGVISLYSSKIVDKKKTLRTVSNTGTYCSCDNVCTVTEYNILSKIPLLTSMHFASRLRTWLVFRLYSVLCTVQ